MFKKYLNSKEDLNNLGLFLGFLGNLFNFISVFSAPEGNGLITPEGTTYEFVLSLNPLLGQIGFFLLTLGFLLMILANQIKS